jgi:iron complex transport system substrate-binding protein
MTGLDRRTWLAGLASILAAAPARALEINDAAGRTIAVPGAVARVFPAGPPAAVLLYTLAPDLLVGWPRVPGPQERAFLLPEIADRPEVGRITGRGNTANLEAVLAAKPDLILDVGSTSATYVSLAERVQAQTGIPYILLDGGLAQSAAAYRTLGTVLGRAKDAAELAGYADATLALVRDRVASVPPDHRPRVYYARGPRGLETGRGGSINVESLSLMGALNVAGDSSGGLANVSIEQVLAWNPDAIVTIEPAFAASVRTDPAWSSVKAVREGRVHLAPRLPFSWIDFPPSVNRLIGLRWLGRVLYPDLFPEDIAAEARAFYARSYHVTPTEAQIAGILAGAP